MALTSLRRSPRAVTDTLVSSMQFFDAEFVRIDDFVGLPSDGRQLTAADVHLGLRYLERCYGALEKIDRNLWRVVSFDRYAAGQCDRSAWNDDGTSPTRQPAKRVCDRCGIQMAPMQRECDYCDWGYA